MCLFNPPFVILEKSLLTSKVFLEVQQIPCSSATALLEYITLNYITL